VIEGMMANIAVIFHWAPSEMYEMDVSDLRRWHALALERAPKKGK